MGSNRPDPADRGKSQFGGAEECVSKCGIPFLGRWMFALIAHGGMYGFTLVSCRFHAGFRPDAADRGK